MLIDHDLRCLILLNPRTGTTTLRSLFPELNSSHYVHAKYAEAAAAYPDYTKFCFWRDPVERFVSTLSYMKDVYLNELPEDSVRNGLSILGCDRIHEVTAHDVIRVKESGGGGPVLDLFDHQLDWFGPDVSLLNFSNFFSECAFLQLVLMSKRKRPITQLNSSKRIYVSEDEKAAIAEYCKPDYEYEWRISPWVM